MFAIVKDCEGEKKFTKWHNRLEEAREEAIRLSSKENGKKFMVLHFIGSAQEEKNIKWAPAVEWNTERIY